MIRFSRIMKAYRPFIYLVWAACINSLLNSVLLFYSKNVSPHNLIFDLCEAVFLIWFYKNMGAFRRTKPFFYVFIFVFAGISLGEGIWGDYLGNTFHSWFRIFYSFLIVLLSINSINRIILKEKDVFRNSAFLINIGTFVYFTYKGTIEIFWLYGLDINEDFIRDVYMILLYINLFCNMIYSLAILWMRRQQPVTLQF